MVVSDVAFSPDGSLLATVGEDSQLRIHPLAHDALIALAQQTVTRELTQEECKQSSIARLAQRSL
jgi:glucose/arabinose dehydrogenase